MDLRMTIKSGDELEVGDRIVNVGRIEERFVLGAFVRVDVHGGRWLGSGEHTETRETMFFHQADDVVVWAS